MATLKTCDKCKEEKDTFPYGKCNYQNICDDCWEYAESESIEIVVEVTFLTSVGLLDNLEGEIQHMLSWENEPEGLTFGDFKVIYPPWHK